jgi:transcriptional regulator
MYIPPAFLESRIDVMHDLIRSHPLGLLITAGAGGLQATPIPFLVEAPADGGNGVLRGHLARANTHLKDLAAAAECLVVFQGEQGYVTPNWYPSKQEDGKVVPTWNYITVQAWGQPTLIDDPAWLQGLLEDLTGAQERARAVPWEVGSAPKDYIEAMKAAIVGIKIPVARMEGKWKLSQNRSAADWAGVVAGMGDPADPHHNLTLAELVAERLRNQRPR